MRFKGGNMRNQQQLIIGAALLILGLLWTIGALTGVSIGRFLFPLLLIGLGVWFILRPQVGEPGARDRFKILGDVKLSETGQIEDQSMWIGIGDVDLDLSHAEVPIGETLIRAEGFVGDVKLIVPDGVGVKVQSVGLIVDTKVLGNKEDGFLSPVEITSPDWHDTERHVLLKTGHFIGDIQVRRF
jgi:lia operon protein LiaF